MSTTISVPLNKREVEYLLILIKEDIPQATLENRKETNVTLHNLLSDKSTRIDLETLNKICRALNIQPGDILEYATDPEPAG